jgi:hypothetical protein
MSVSTNPRIIRNPPKRQFTESTYRAAKPFLLRDFDGRCAYSLEHADLVGYKTMEVDHFNPNLRGLWRNKYVNLFPATRHCNGSKTDCWPNAQLRKAGVRFLNPTKEQDYGVHIFEDADTHELVGVSPAGRYHIRCCDLNAPHLIRKRRDRALLRELLDHYLVTSKVPLPLVDSKKFGQTSAQLREIVERMIPPIRAVPTDSKRSGASEASTPMDR